MKLLCRSLETNQLAILDSKSKAKHFNAFEQGADESLWQVPFIMISGFSISKRSFFLNFSLLKFPNFEVFFEKTSDFEKP